MFALGYDQDYTKSMHCIYIYLLNIVLWELLKKEILSDFSGKVGSVVDSNWKGI